MTSADAFIPPSPGTGREPRQNRTPQIFTNSMNRHMEPAEHTPAKNNTTHNIKTSLPLRPLYKQSSILNFCNKQFSTPPFWVIVPSIPPIIQKKTAQTQEPLHVFTDIQPTTLQFSPVRNSLGNTTTLQRSPTSSTYTPHSIRTQTKITTFFKKKRPQPYTITSVNPKYTNRPLY
jgi:hypothetical protein